jgi:hypothetical protein
VKLCKKNQTSPRITLMKSSDLGGPVIGTPETFPPRPPFLRVSKVLVFPDQCSSVLISGKFWVCFSISAIFGIFGASGNLFLSALIRGKFPFLRCLRSSVFQRFWLSLIPQLILLHFRVGIVMLKNLLKGRSMARHVCSAALAQSNAVPYAHAFQHH